MKIDNLYVGQVIKNYEELTKVLEIEFKPSNNTNGRKSQKNELSRYVKYHNEGYKFIIDEIYDTPKEKVENRGGNNSIFQEDFRFLLMYLLHNDRSECMVMSKTALFKALNLVNNNYQIARGNISRLAQIIQVPERAIQDFYDYNSKKIRETVERNLRACRREALLIHENVECVATSREYILTDEWGNPLRDIFGEVIKEKIYNYREAEKEEKQAILESERETLIEMGLIDTEENAPKGFCWFDDISEEVPKKNKNNIFLSKKQRLTFNKKVKQKLKDRGINIEFYYRGYRLTWNNSTIDEEYRKLCKYMDCREQAEKESLAKININNNMIKSINKSTEKRHIKALEEIKYASTPILIDKYSEPSKEGYIEEQNIITSTLIDYKARDLTKEIKPNKR